MTRLITDGIHSMRLSKNLDTVLVFDKFGNLRGELKNTPTINILYIQKHPSFGLSVVVSIKDEVGNWKDVIMAFENKQFVVKSQAR